MAVVVLTERLVLPSKERMLMTLLKSLQIKAESHKGFIKSRLYRDASDERKFIVISEWQHRAAWDTWRSKSVDRIEIRDQMSDCQFGPTKHSVLVASDAESRDDFRL